jgi:hypothetical protein
VAQYRKALPQLDGSLFLTDGGIETTLIFHEGGKGHISRGVGTEDRISLFIPLAEK